MKGDFTRNTFKKEKHYTGVRMQQGRVQLDADWNEQVDIQNHLRETAASDLGGSCGVSQENAGFHIVPTNTNNDVVITPGKYFVDGILCENEKRVTYAGQPHFHGEFLPKANGGYLFYLDVWKRHISSIEDASILDVALDGADTTTRTEIIWQVKTIQPTRDDETDDPCRRDTKEWKRLTQKRNSRLKARANPDNTILQPPIAGFRGTDNQLYRIEIHTSGQIGDATFKWSRVNGSIAANISTIQDNNSVTIEQTGKSQALDFAAGDWVEVLDDKHEFEFKPGALVRLKSVINEVELIFDPASATEEITNASFAKNPRIRRWDQHLEGEIKTSATNWQPIENGLEVTFNEDGEFSTGDYWIIPTRAVTGEIEWPLDDNGKPAFQERQGIKHHYCPLAYLSLGNGTWDILKDCRGIYSSLAEQLQLFYVSGDGQEIEPGSEEPILLEVGVTNGLMKVGGARVKFEIVRGMGKVRESKDVTVRARSFVIVETKPIGDPFHGVAQCYFWLDANAAHTGQQVEANLLDPENKKIHLPFRFNINIERASRLSRYSLPDCGAKLPTVKSLFGNLLQSKWPDVDEDGVTTTKDILDAILCHLDAERLPFKPNCQSDLFANLPEETVGHALNEICKIRAKHIVYEVKEENCGAGDRDPSVRTFLDLSKGLTKLDIILKKLLCEFDAEKLPFIPGNCDNDLFDDLSTFSVGHALNEICKKFNANQLQYSVQNCGDSTTPTVRSLLDIASGDTKINAIFDKLLCGFDAEKLPNKQSDTLSRFPQQVKTVFSALEYLIQQIVPPGAIVGLNSDTIPEGWLKCDGQAISRTNYRILFEAIGTSFGPGNGATTFNVPNLSGRTLVGSGTYTDSVAGAITRNRGESIGAAEHGLTVAEMPAHSHFALAPPHDVDGAASQGWPAGNNHNSFRTSDRGRIHLTHVSAITESGGSNSHNNMQPSYVVNYIIKT